MTRTRFHQGLDELRSKLLTMAGMAEHAIDRAMDAYARRDASECDAVRWP